MGSVGSGGGCGGGGVGSLEHEQNAVGQLTGLWLQLAMHHASETLGSMDLHLPCAAAVFAAKPSAKRTVKTPFILILLMWSFFCEDLHAVGPS